MSKISEKNNSNNQSLISEKLYEDLELTTKKPSMYEVLMLNDDFTPMDFVVLLLKNFFNKSFDEATQTMLNIHQKGSALCGIYSYEIAETKTLQVMKAAKDNGHPLQCIFIKN